MNTGKKYTVRLASNNWGEVVANVLNRYEHGQTLAPNIDINNAVKLPTVKVEMSDDTKRLVKFVGFSLAAAIAFEGITRLTNK